MRITIIFEIYIYFLTPTAFIPAKAAKQKLAFQKKSSSDDKNENQFAVKQMLVKLKKTIKNDTKPATRTG